MKLIPASIAADLANANARTTPMFAQQWRKALEDAQWQMRQRQGAESEPEAQRAGASNAESAVPVDSERALGSTPSSAVAQASPSLSLQGVARVDSLTAAITQMLQRIAIASEAGVSLGGASIVRADPAEAGTVNLVQRQAVRAPSLYELPEWPDVMLHVSVQGSAISIGMRDRGLAEVDALTLFYRLKAQLRAIGLELDALTVNGYNAAPPHDGVVQDV